MSNPNHGATIRLEGDWSTGGISHQYRVLCEYLQQLGNSTPAAPELDLSGITHLDACGCQLLATFVAGLRRLGFEPAGTIIPEQLFRTISSMGFHQPLGGLEYGSGHYQ